MNLVEALQQDMEQSEMTVKEFSESIGISVRSWNAVKEGTRRFGGKALMGILRKYKRNKKITGLVWDYIETYPIKENGNG
jgi:hypothetical protein